MPRLLLALLFTTGALLSGCAIVNNDPLHIGGEGSGSTGATAALGQQVAFTALTVTNDTDDRFIVTSVRVRPAGPVDGVRIAAVYAIDTLDTDYTLGAGLWPDADYPEGSLHPAVGYPVRPHHTVDVLFVVEAGQQGRWAYDGLDIEYVGSGGLHSATWEYGWVICVELQEDCTPSLS